MGFSPTVEITVKVSRLFHLVLNFFADPKTTVHKQEKNFTGDNFPGDKETPDFSDTVLDRTQLRKDFFRNLLKSDSDDKMDLKVYLLFTIAVQFLGKSTFFFNTKICESCQINAVLLFK